MEISKVDEMRIEDVRKKIVTHYSGLHNMIVSYAQMLEAMCEKHGHYSPAGERTLGDLFSDVTGQLGRVDRLMDEAILDWKIFDDGKE